MVARVCCSSHSLGICRAACSEPPAHVPPPDEFNDTEGIVRKKRKVCYGSQPSACIRYASVRLISANQRVCLYVVNNEETSAARMPLSCLPLTLAILVRHHRPLRFRIFIVHCLQQLLIERHRTTWWHTPHVWACTRGRRTSCNCSRKRESTPLNRSYSTCVMHFTLVYLRLRVKKR